jgi:cellulose synthase/poly-beta-1,6-N-acetylglucosamine synthase-like glycosyltransferase
VWFRDTLFVVQILLLCFWGYWAFISLFGFGTAKPIKDRLPEKRFLLIIPAHNEAQVIGNLVENLNNLDYPNDLYDVLVVADNCNDSTAHISRSNGAIVLEHFSPPSEPKGKPYAIKYALDTYGSSLTVDYDAVAVFDADNLVSMNYLKQMNNHLLNGDTLIQCYLDSKNANDNWVTMSYATSYYYMNRSWQLAKSRLGLGNAIGGTGFCVSSELLQRIGWTARSLTEDLEFTMQCLLEGIPARWAHHTRVYDEKPLSFKASVVQRLRWARGHWDVCFRYVGPLFWKFIRHVDVKSLDGAMYLLNPGKIVVGFFMGTAFYVDVILGRSFIQALFPWWMWATLIVLNLVYVGYSVVSDSFNKLPVIRSIISLFMLNYSYVPLFFWAIFTTRDKNWRPTKHTRNLNTDALQHVYTDVTIQP